MNDGERRTGRDTRSTSRSLAGSAILAFAIATSFAACSGSGTRSQTPRHGSLSATARIWRPSRSDTFEWQLSGTLDAGVSASVYDVDAFGTPASFVATAHSLGRHVVCYVDAGSFERNRPDASAFPASVLGETYVGYPDERWLDIRQLAILQPIMVARLDLCRQKHFDAVEPDNIDGWQNHTGFPLTAQDQIAYDRWFAGEAHARGLSVALKNDGDQVSALLPRFDFALTEGCWFESSCARYAPFVAASKPVFTLEYTDNTSSATFAKSVCPRARAAGMTALLKARTLDAPREECR